jgi:phosphoribosyl 1,2-cyclic phosphodiesterase
MWIMQVIPLQSGSSGNCYYVESDSTRLLIDAGISPRQAMLRLQTHDRDIAAVDGLLITHDHRDHCRFVGELCLKYDLPVYLTAPTLAALKGSVQFALRHHAICFKAGCSWEIGDFQVHSIPTPHDATDGVAFVIENNGRRLGILTDLGHAFDGLRQVLGTLDAVVIESNYDEMLLASSRYPAHLKRRIRGAGGHLSNEDSARLIHQHGSPLLQWVCLCHLSAENNCPDTALRTHQDLLGEELPLYVASRTAASKMMKLR